jgi:sporulation protein YlmC with PRC-barrel domain
LSIASSSSSSDRGEIPSARNPGRFSEAVVSICHPDHECISSEDVQGTEVYGPAGKHIGEIDHLIIDKMSGRVAYAVMSFGGFMGLGHNHYPIPWGALTYDKSLGGFRTNITEQLLVALLRALRSSHRLQSHTIVHDRFDLVSGLSRITS